MFLSLNFTLIHDVSMKEVLSKKKNSNLWDLGASRTPTILQRGIMRRTRVRFHIFFGKPGKSGRSKLFADLGANLSQIRFCFFKLDIPVLRGFFLTLCCGVFVFIAASPRHQSLEISFFAKPFGNKNCVKKISWPTSVLQILNLFFLGHNNAFSKSLCSSSHNLKSPIVFEWQHGTKPNPACWPPVLPEKHPCGMRNWLVRQLASALFATELPCRVRYPNEKWMSEKLEAIKIRFPTNIIFNGSWWVPHVPETNQWPVENPGTRKIHNYKYRMHFCEHFNVIGRNFNGAEVRLCRRYLPWDGADKSRAWHWSFELSRSSCESTGRGTNLPTRMSLVEWTLLVVSGFLFRGSGNINCMLEFCVGWGILFWFSTSCQLKFLNSDMFVDSSCQNFMSKRIKMSDFDPVGFWFMVPVSSCFWCLHGGSWGLRPWSSTQWAECGCLGARYFHREKLGCFFLG